MPNHDSPEPELSGSVRSMTDSTNTHVRMSAPMSGATPASNQPFADFMLLRKNHTQAKPESA